MIGHGEHPADQTNEGWKDKMHAAMMAGQRERDERIKKFKDPSTVEPTS